MLLAAGILDNAMAVAMSILSTSWPNGSHQLANGSLQNPAAMSTITIS